MRWCIEYEYFVGYDEVVFDCEVTNECEALCWDSPHLRYFVPLSPVNCFDLCDLVLVVWKVKDKFVIYK